MNRRADITTKIKEDEHKLSALRTNLDSTASRLTALREELASLLPEADTIALSPSSREHVDSPVSNEQKIVLFRSLFRGREDVFAPVGESPDREVGLLTRLHKRMERRDLPKEQVGGDSPQTHLRRLPSSSVPPSVR